jgi:lysophospholipase L1-like esterase
MKKTIVMCTIFTALIMTSFLPMPKVSAASNYDTYVALGDSVASGAGLGGNLNATCDRSSSAYPTLLASKLGTTVTNLACSGAKVDEGIYGNQKRDASTITPQLEAAFAGGTPDLITLTIGANDVRWANYLRDCYVFECGSALDKARAVVYRADLRYELSKALTIIQQRSNGTPPTVLVNGYYSPFSRTACSATEKITLKERLWINEQKGYLNDSLRTVTRSFSFAKYVPVDFGSHKVCSSNTWLQGPNATAPFHPNAAGQQAIANSNYRALSR